MQNENAVAETLDRKLMWLDAFGLGKGAFKLECSLARGYWSTLYTQTLTG
jgi:hypothetical protein